MSCVVENGSLCYFARLFPSLVPEFVELWCSSADAHVTRDKVTLVDWDMQCCAIVILDSEFFAAAFSIDKADEFTDAIVGVDHKSAFVELMDSGKGGRVALLGQLFFLARAGEMLSPKNLKS